jgi:signal peptidase II
MQAARGTPLTPTPPARRRGGLLPLVLLVALGVVVVDQVSKAIVVARLEGHDAVHVIGTFLILEVTRNSGAAFSLGTGSTVLFSAIAIAVIVVLVRVSQRLTSVWWAIAFGGLLGGALGNLVCRIFRAPGPFRGYVVDWIQLPHWPVFNVADACITCSAVLMVILSIRDVPLTGARVADSTETADGGNTSTTDTSASDASERNTGE